jgi:transposase
MPGIKRRLAEVLLAEIGADMRRFPSARHLASWTGMCPGNHESAGKRLSGRTRKGSPWLRTALVEATHAAVQYTILHRYLYWEVAYSSQMIDESTDSQCNKGAINR